MNFILNFIWRLLFTKWVVCSTTSNEICFFFTFVIRSRVGWWFCLRGALLFQSSVQGDHNLTRTGTIAMFTQPKALPCAQIKTTVGDGQVERRAEKTGLDMGRHVIRSFAWMAEWSILWMWRERRSHLNWYQDDWSIRTMIEIQMKSQLKPAQETHLRNHSWQEHFHVFSYIRIPILLTDDWMVEKERKDEKGVE